MGYEEKKDMKFTRDLEDWEIDLGGIRRKIGVKIIKIYGMKCETKKKLKTMLLQKIV